MNTLLKADRISLKIDRDRWIFRDISLALEANSICFLMGRSGAGKSLFLKALGQLIPIHHGEILWRNAPIGKDIIPLFRSCVQYLPTGFGRGDECVGEQLKRAFAFKTNRDQKKSYDPKALEWYLERFGLEKDFLQKKSYQLSGGESQMAVLLRSFILGPEILLLDEPTSAMDAHTKERAEGLIKEFILGEGRAAIWITHDLEQARRLGHRTLTLEKEKFIEV